MHIKALVKDHIQKYAPHIAFQMRSNSGYRRLTYAQARDAVKALAAQLVSAGIKKGDRVAILSENRPEWSITYLAITSLSAVAVPIDIMLHRKEIEPLLMDCEAKAVILSERAREQAGPGLAKIEINIEDVDFLTPPASDEVFSKFEANDEDLAAIIYTSGTTGRSKGVMLTHSNIMSNVAAIASVHRVGVGDNFLSVLPLHHTFECTVGMLAPLYVGATITYADQLKSHALIANMQETGVTLMCGVPLLYQLFYDGILREVEAKGPAVKKVFAVLMKLAKLIPSPGARRKLFPMIHKKLGGKINFWVSGGAPIDPEVIRGFELFGLRIIQGYGLTETSPILTSNTMEANRIGSVGRPLPGVELKVSKEGEILARGPNIMKGYYKRPDLTAEVIRDGWFYTGDIGRLDKDGFYYITGRSKDVIVTGSGKNVYPDELEFRLKKIKGVSAVCVVGSRVKDGVRAGSEEVWAVVQPDYEYYEKTMKIKDRKEVELSLVSRIMTVNEELADFKRISNVVIREEDFPKTTTRKIKKFHVKKEMGLV